MACELCAANQAEFSSEICIHFPGRKNLDKPAWLRQLPTELILVAHHAALLR